MGASDDTRSGARRRGRRRPAPVEGAATIVEAGTAEDAIAEVHATYGARARILDARLVRRGGMGGFFAREVVQLHVAPPQDDIADLAAPDPNALLDGSPPDGAVASVPGDRPRSPVDRLLGDDRILDLENPADDDFAAMLGRRLDTPATPRRRPAAARSPQPAPVEEPARPTARETARALARELAIAAREDAVAAGREAAAAREQARHQPVTPPAAAPVETPAAAPAATAPVETPVTAPVTAPVETPVTAPPAATAPVETPAAAPVETPAATAPAATAPTTPSTPDRTDVAGAISPLRALIEAQRGDADSDDQPVRWPQVDVDESARLRPLPSGPADAADPHDRPAAEVDPTSPDALSEAAAALLTDPSTLWAASAEALRRSESARLVRERAEAEAREWAARLALTDPPPADVIPDRSTAPAATATDTAPAPAATATDTVPPAPAPTSTPTRRPAVDLPPDQLPRVADGGVGWTATGLLRLGLPGELVHGLRVDDPHDDLAWTAAMTAALRSLCRPLPAGDSVLVGPLADTALSEAAHAPAARSALWLDALRERRWMHLVVGGEGWRDRLDDEPLAVSWARADDLPDAIRCAAELGLVLGYGPMGGKVRRARPMDVALAIRDLVDER